MEKLDQEGCRKKKILLVSAFSLCVVLLVSCCRVVRVSSLCRKNTERYSGVACGLAVEPYCRTLPVSVMNSSLAGLIMGAL